MGIVEAREHIGQDEAVLDFRGLRSKSYPCVKPKIYAVQGQGLRGQKEAGVPG